MPTSSWGRGWRAMFMLAPEIYDAAIIAAWPGRERAFRQGASSKILALPETLRHARAQPPCPVRSRALERHTPGEPAPGRPRRADRLRELREPPGTGRAGQPAHQQVRRGLSRPALLRRL